jgi:hypothetical protein
MGTAKQTALILPGVRADMQPIIHRLKACNTTQNSGLAATRPPEQCSDAMHRALERDIERKGTPRTRVTGIDIQGLSTR